MTDDGGGRIGVSIEVKPHAYDPVANPELFEGVLVRRSIAFLIDIVIIARHPNWWLETDEWLEQLGTVRTVDLEDDGPVQSRRVRYENGIEVEFGITMDEWPNTAPIDEGSRRVMADGHRILNDKAGLRIGRIGGVRAV